VPKFQIFASQKKQNKTTKNKNANPPIANVGLIFWGGEPPKSA
jgi:hypothetical protein